MSTVARDLSTARRGEAALGGRARLLGIRLPEAVNAFREGGPISYLVEVSVLERMDAFTISHSFRTSDGQKLGSGFSNPVPAGVGRFEVSVALEGMNLAPGRYLLGVAIGSGDASGDPLLLRRRAGCSRDHDRACHRGVRLGFPVGRGLGCCALSPQRRRARRVSREPRLTCWRAILYPQPTSRGTASGPLRQAAGQRIRTAAPKLYDLARKASPRLTGPFSLKTTTATRAFEFPWAYEAIAPAPGMKVLEIGGSLAGLQFALARAGAEVTNVDPGEDTTGMGWPVDQRRIDRLNRSLGTQVSLINSTLGEAAIGGEVFDAVVSVSTIEHIPATDHPSLMAEIARVLKPGGRCVLTVDLFLNLQPFSDRVSNQFGTNADIAR